MAARVVGLTITVAALSALLAVALGPLKQTVNQAGASDSCVFRRAT